MCEKDKLFQLMQSQPIKKSFFQRTTTPTFHCTKANVQQPFSNIACYCELALQQSFFENISLALAVQLPFRTDSKPLCRRFAGKTGFDMSRRKTLQNHFRQSFESFPESRGSQTSGVLLVLFVQAKSTKNVSFAGSSEVLQTSIQPTAVTFSHRNN